MICTDSSSFFGQKETTLTRSNLEKHEESCIIVDENELQFLARNKGKH